MSYTENELKAWSYPLNEKDCEQCLAVLNIVKNECKKLGYKEIGELLDGRESGADYGYSLAKGSKRLLLQVVGGYAENSVGCKKARMTIAAVADNETTAKELLEALDTRLIAYGAEVSEALPWRISFGSVYKGLYLLVGYEAAEGCYFAKKSGFELCYPKMDAAEIQRKTKATDYSFKKQLRLVKTLVAQMYQEGLPEVKGICPMKLEHLMCNLEDVVYTRFDSLSERLSYVVLQLIRLLEKSDKVLLEANGKKRLFATQEEQKRYLDCLLALNKRLVE